MNFINASCLQDDSVYEVFAHFRTVEVNNTDAEGRLVLGDGVSFEQFYVIAGSYNSIYFVCYK